MAAASRASSGSNPGAVARKISKLSMLPFSPEPAISQVPLRDLIADRELIG